MRWQNTILAAVVVLLLIVIALSYTAHRRTCTQLEQIQIDLGAVDRRVTAIEEQVGPGPGPIIVVEPQSGKASWRVGTSSATFGNSNEIRADATGTVDWLRAVIGGSSRTVDRWTVKIKADHDGLSRTIEAKDVSGTLTWYIDGVQVSTCAIGSCAGDLPVEFKGDWEAMDAWLGTAKLTGPGSVGTEASTKTQ